MKTLIHFPDATLASILSSRGCPERPGEVDGTPPARDRFLIAEPEGDHRLTLTLVDNRMAQLAPEK